MDKRGNARSLPAAPPGGLVLSEGLGPRCGGGSSPEGSLSPGYGGVAAGPRRSLRITRRGPSGNAAAALEGRASGQGRWGKAG